MKFVILKFDSKNHEINGFHTQTCQKKIIKLAVSVLKFYSTNDEIACFNAPNWK